MGRSPARPTEDARLGELCRRPLNTAAVAAQWETWTPPVYTGQVFHGPVSGTRGLRVV